MWSILQFVTIVLVLHLANNGQAQSTDDINEANARSTDDINEANARSTDDIYAANAQSTEDNIYAANAQSRQSDLCSTLAPIQNFNTTAYLGQWYESQRYRNVDKVQPTCVSSFSRYSRSRDGTIETVFSESVGGAMQSFTGKANSTQQATVGRFDIQFSTQLAYANGQYSILATDYNSYALIASCKNGLVNGDNILASIYTRQPNPDNKVVHRARIAAGKAGLKVHNFKTISQEGCKYPKNDLEL